MSRYADELAAACDQRRRDSRRRYGTAAWGGGDQRTSCMSKVIDHDVAAPFP
ncbi:hypothetical protein [Streptomyces sp. NPDC057686]|uniref:hypothetical protein n=1 Tax=Streptomyces sp. NPDC057686 TaxID=3346212 RepID=UPI0036790EFD